MFDERPDGAPKKHLLAPWQVDPQLYLRHEHLFATADEDLPTGSLVVWSGLHYLGLFPVASSHPYLTTGTVRLRRAGETPQGVVACADVKRGDMACVQHKGLMSVRVEGIVPQPVGELDNARTRRLELRRLRRENDTYRRDLEMAHLANDSLLTSRARQETTIRNLNARIETLRKARKPGQCSSQKYMHWGSSIACVLGVRHSDQHTNGSWRWSDNEEGVTSAAHSCKPPLGNPTREEAIGALREIAHEVHNTLAGPFDRLGRIQGIARAALPKTERGS